MELLIYVWNCKRRRVQSLLRMHFQILWMAVNDWWTFFDAIALLGNSLGACMLPVNQMHTWKCDFAFSHATGVMRREHSLLPPSAGIDDKQAHTTLKEKWVYFSFFLSVFARKLNLLAVSAGVVKLERKMQVENRAEERSWRCEHHEHDV